MAEYATFSAPPYGEFNKFTGDYSGRNSLYRRIYRTTSIYRNGINPAYELRIPRAEYGTI